MNTCFLALFPAMLPTMQEDGGCGIMPLLAPIELFVAFADADLFVEKRERSAGIAMPATMRAGTWPAATRSPALTSRGHQSRGERLPSDHQRSVVGLGYLEAGDVVLRDAFGILGVLRLSTRVDSSRMPVRIEG